MNRAACPAQSVDPGVDERREHPAVEDDAGDDAREESEGELALAHRAAEGSTVRTYPGVATGRGAREPVWIGPARRHAPKGAGAGPQSLIFRLGGHAIRFRRPRGQDPSSYRVKSPIQAAKASAVASVLRRSTSNTTRASFRARQRIASRCVLPSARFRARYAFARS